MVRAVVVMVALVGLVGGVESGGVAAPRTFRAVVIAVDGGDTLRVVPLAGKASAPLSVRIAGIAAPKRDQRSGAAARAFVDERVFGEVVVVQPTAPRARGVISLAARVRWRGRDLGALLAKAGWAWHDTRTKRFAQLARLAAAARAAKRGLWANASAVAPWTFQRVALWGDVKRKTAHHSWDCAVTKRGWPPGGTLFYSLADARKGGYRLHRCITARYQRLIADNAPQSSGVPSPPASGRCRRDRDCALAPHPPCVCGSCGGTWRKPTTRARARAMKARFSRLRCEPQACPACVTRYLGTRAVCVAGRCSVR